SNKSNNPDILDNFKIQFKVQNNLLTPTFSALKLLNPSGIHYFKRAMIWFANSSPILFWASFVEPPIWGVREIFGCMRIFISGVGSDSYTSNPAKETLPPSRASIRAT